MKTKKKTVKTTKKTKAKKPASSRKAPAKKRSTGAVKKPAKKSGKSAALARDENAACDDEANRELGIRAAMPARVTVRGAGAATRAASDSWRPAKSLVTLKDQVNAKAPGRNKSHDGMVGDARHRTRNSDHNPWVDDGVVTAYDITDDPANNCNVNDLAEAIRTAKDPRVKYLIWRRRICNHAPMGAAAAWAWRPYGGSNPHDKHLHISVKETRAHYDNTAPWPV